MSDDATRPAPPPLDLAPRLDRPLSLWNPLDHLKLVYWALFFPQAIQAYSSYPNYNQQLTPTSNKHLTRHLSSMRVLVSGILFASLVHLILLGFLKIFNFQLNILVFIAFFVFASISSILNTLIFQAGIVSDLSRVFLIFFNTNLSLLLWSILIATHSIESIGGTFLGIAFGFILNTTQTKTTGHWPYFAGAISLHLYFMTLSVTLLTAINIMFSDNIRSRSILSNNFISILLLTFTQTFPGILMTFRPLDWLVSYVLVDQPPSRATPLPLPGVRQRLRRDFEQSWQQGVTSASHYLQWTFQFWVVIQETHSQLDSSPSALLLKRTTTLIDSHYDWQLMRFGSVSLKNSLIRDAIDSLFLISPHRYGSSQLKRYFPTDLRYDTPARAACAGFWLWHQADAPGARDAFGHLLEIPHGPELFAISDAIARAEPVDDLEALATWRGPHSADYPKPLRPGTLRGLQTLGEAAESVWRAAGSRSKRVRQEAFGLAIGRLQALVDDGLELCESPENRLIVDIAEEWRDLVSRATGRAAEVAIRERVENPFVGYSGRPVRGHAFVGRVGAMSRLERHLSSPSPPALFVYGHRRMGKTSILLNLDHHLGDEVLVVYLDMQDLAQEVDGPGDLLFDTALALHRRLQETNLRMLPEPIHEDYASAGAAKRAFAGFLADLEPRLGDRRIVLAFDEFEYLEKGLDEERLDLKLLERLRTLQNRHGWLALVFGGLHTLEEMNREYFAPFFGQHENVHVGYLSRTDTFDLLANPDPDFDLDFEEPLLEELHRLTHGQPYLLQRLAWELVEGWNQRFLENIEPIPRVLHLTDLEPLLDADFFAAADYYFEGVWSQLDPEEQDLLRVLARRESAWALDELQTELNVANLEPGDLESTLGRLVHHDVVLRETTAEGEERVRFAAELLRRWILRMTPRAE